MKNQSGRRGKEMKIKKKAYADLGDCIVSDQVPAHKVAMYFEDEDFLKWYRKKYLKKYPKGTSHKGKWTKVKMRK